MDGRATIVDRDRLDPVALVCAEIVERVRATQRLRMRDHFLRKLAAIERFAMRFGDLLHRLRHRLGAPHLAGLHRATVRHEVIRPAGDALEDRHCSVPFHRDDRGHMVSATRVVDPGREQVGERQLAEARGKEAPR